MPPTIMVTVGMLAVLALAPPLVELVPPELAPPELHAARLSAVTDAAAASAANRVLLDMDVSP
jgi:hypothetical protein